jgi:NADH:ubiquinone oxidoreductase subunit 3 (subunit A)
MDKKQTAVDYYSKQIGKLTANLVTGRITGKQFVMLEIKLNEQAKEMEKEQIIDAYECGFESEHDARIPQSSMIYYNKTYGDNK